MLVAKRRHEGRTQPLQRALDHRRPYVSAATSGETISDYCRDNVGAEKAERQTHRELPVGRRTADTVANAGVQKEILDVGCQMMPSSAELFGRSPSVL